MSKRDPQMYSVYQAHATELWSVLSANAKTGIRFGLFPADVMRECERLGYDDTKMMASALMEMAEKNGGMRA